MNGKAKKCVILLDLGYTLTVSLVQPIVAHGLKFYLFYLFIYFTGSLINLHADNLALGKTAIQSSTDNEGSAHRAIDGIRGRGYATSM